VGQRSAAGSRWINIEEIFLNFTDWLESLAPEGETLLYVRQKPLSDPPTYHADGAMKATWPAFRPGKVRKDGAWYANTASFIEERLVERVSAAAANCDYCLVLVLDDIGTKSKTPPLAPTWVMETSAGNFQWGYAFKFDAQPKKGDFAAAVRAIADAGYTDPGACNPVRNFRIPGSVNTKKAATLSRPAWWSSTPSGSSRCLRYAPPLA
jgi:hypothetical protein